jgi:hypothetical protein
MGNSYSSAVRSAQSPTLTASSLTGVVEKCRAGSNCDVCRRHIIRLVTSSATEEVMRQCLRFGRFNTTIKRVPTEANSKTLITVATITNTSLPIDTLNEIDENTKQLALTTYTSRGLPSSCVDPSACVTDFNYNIDGYTPLEAAARFPGSTEAITLLLEYGARITPRIINELARASTIAMNMDTAAVMALLVTYDQLTIDNAIRSWGYRWLRLAPTSEWIVLIRCGGLDPWIMLDELTDKPMPAAALSSSSLSVLYRPLWEISLTGTGRSRYNSMKLYQLELQKMVLLALTQYMSHDIIDAIVIKCYLCPIPSLTGGTPWI